MIYILISIVIVIISANLFKRGCGTVSLYQPNMMSVILYYYLILQCVIGGTLVINHWDNHYIINKLQYESSRHYGYWAIMYTMIAFPIGMLITNRFWRVFNIKKLFNDYCRREIILEYKYNDCSVKYICVLFSLLAFCATIYVTTVIGEISLIKAIKGSSALDLAMLRADTSRHFPGNEYVKNIFALGLTPLMSYVAYAYKLRNASVFNRVWFWLMFLAAIQIVSYNLEKAPILIYLIGFLFFRIYTGHPITKKQLLFIGCIILVGIVGLYIMIMGAGVDIVSLFSYNSGIVGRLTLSSIAGFFFSFDLWPNTEDFIGFSSISQFISEAFGLPYSERAARIIMETTNPEGVKMGVAGVVNSLFTGEAWANWGIVGLIFSPIIVGGLIQLLYLFFLKSPKTPFFLAVFVNFSFKSAITGGVNDYIYNVQGFIIICLILSIYSSSKILYNSQKHHGKKNNISPAS